MKRAILSFLALAALTCLASAQPAPPPRLEPLVDGCTHDGRWCARFDAVSRRVLVARGGQEIAAITEHVDEGDDLGAWTSIVRVDNNRALVGVTRTLHTMYSGGGASVTWLTLYEVSPLLPPRGVLDAPMSGQVDLRACFSEADVSARLNQCSDQYDYTATLKQDRAGNLIYAARAQTYPGRLSRGEDSTARPPLRVSDLRPWRDPICTFQRTLTLGADGAYAWSAARPACADYLEP